MRQDDIIRIMKAADHDLTCVEIIELYKKEEEWKGHRAEVSNRCLMPCHISYKMRQLEKYGFVKNVGSVKLYPHGNMAIVWKWLG